MKGDERPGSLSPGVAEAGVRGASDIAPLTVEAEQVRLLFTQAPMGLSADACTAAAVAGVLASTGGSPWLVAWCLVLIVVYAITSALIHRYRREGGERPARWARAFLVCYLPSGVMWGMTCLFMASATPVQQFLLVIVFVGICASSVAILASVFWVYCSYIGAILVPWGLWFLLSPASPHPILGALIVPFAVLVTSTARNYSMSLQRSFHLAVELQVAKTRVDAANRELSYEAAHDALTGLINRREFERRLHRLAVPDNCESLWYALLYLDLDQFKVVNDTCGHTVGDELLKQLAATLQSVLGRDGRLARLGGDEFGVLLNRCSADEAERCAWALCDAVEAFRFRWGEQTFKVGVSIGVVPGGGCVELAESALRIADVACLAAKEAGGHRVHVYVPNDENMQRHNDEMRWVTHIGEALDEDRLLLYAQPIWPLNGAAGAGTRFELLLRLRESDGQVVGPGAFLPAAERYGFSVDIDRWVINHLFRWAARYPAYLRRIDVCSVNLSGSSLGNAAFLEALAARIADGPFAASQLCFEVTETSAISNIANAARFMRQLRRLGCAFALDDFGSGLSSLAYLKSLPVDYLKIDGLFVRKIADDRTDRELVKVISETGAIMGLRTVAEFVESERILATLEEIGIDYAQGYHIGMPVPLGQFFADYRAGVESGLASGYY